MSRSDIDNILNSSFFKIPTKIKVNINCDNAKKLERILKLARYSKIDTKGKINLPITLSGRSEIPATPEKRATSDSPYIPARDKIPAISPETISIEVSKPNDQTVYNISIIDIYSKIFYINNNEYYFKQLEYIDNKNISKKDCHAAVKSDREKEDDLQRIRSRSRK